MEERHAQVLQEIVEEYIRLARPVGSSLLAQSLSWTASPATIRTIMHDLEVEGYIYQPHTSAGRMPTDRGYRYYVDHKGSHAVTDAQVERIREGYRELAEEYRHVNRALAKLIAHLSHSMAVSLDTKTQDVQQAGFRSLLKQSNDEESDTMREASDFLDNIDDYLVRLAPQESEPAVIVIGEENQLFNAKDISLIVRRIDVGGGEPVIVAIIGPKRMPYQRHVNVLEGVAQLMEELL